MRRVVFVAVLLCMIVCSVNVGWLGHKLFRPCSRPAMVPGQPSVEDVRVTVRQFVRWIDCETQVVCYASEEGFDCLPAAQVPWVEGECDE